MPHCIIEYSKELESVIEPKLMMSAAHQGAMDSGLFEESHIKSRTLAYEHYKMGVSDLRFIHITAKILSGRTLEQKAELSQNILAQFETLLRANELAAISITVDIRNMEREVYTKNIL